MFLFSITILYHTTVVLVILFSFAINTLLVVLHCCDYCSCCNCKVWDAQNVRCPINEGMFWRICVVIKTGVVCPCREMVIVVPLFFLQSIYRVQGIPHYTGMTVLQDSLPMVDLVFIHPLLLLLNHRTHWSQTHLKCLKQDWMSQGYSQEVLL